MSPEQLRDDLSQQIRAAGYSGFIMIAFPKSDDKGVQITSATSRVYDSPEGAMVIDEDRNLYIKPDATEDEANVTNSLLLSIAKKLANESDFALSRIDEDFLITNVDQILKNLDS